MIENIISQGSYFHFDRKAWSSLRYNEPMTLTSEEVILLKGINENFSTKEVEEIYLPLARLLSYYVESQDNRQSVLMRFLGKAKLSIPFVIGVTGSVSVGKSTTARVLEALLSRGTLNKKVSLVTTDGFLYPNKILEEKKIMHRKGFPESYDYKLLMQFISNIKSGKDLVEVPVYCHNTYDIDKVEKQKVEQSDILIIEGINVLQNLQEYTNDSYGTSIYDYLDFSIYVDAEETDLEEWYISRFMRIREDAFYDEKSYFHEFTKLSEQTARHLAKNIWFTINRENLINHISPSKGRANMIIHKGKNHIVDYVNLRF